MTMAYNHQDWNIVILNPAKKGKQESKEKCQQRPQATFSSVTNKPAWKIEQQVDSDSGKPLQLVSKQDADDVKNKRIACKLTQAQLATKLNMKLKDIQDIESYKAIENKGVISRIKRELDKMLSVAHPI
jgi:ribosome-binding protein aMBF1 (putative translation factor)